MPDATDSHHPSDPDTDRLADAVRRANLYRRAAVENPADADLWNALADFAIAAMKDPDPC